MKVAAIWRYPVKSMAGARLSGAELTRTGFVGDRVVQVYWFTFNGLAAAAHVTTPTLFVHSDGCVFPGNVKQVYASVQGPKELVWASGAQIDFYDQPEQVEQALGAIRRWFERTLAGRPVTA